jgi:hypothetical protein
MYNPPEGGNDTLEFVEIMNPSLTSPINMTGFYIEDAFDFTFPDGFMLGAGEFVLISGDSVSFETWYGVESFEWGGATTQLNNSGESITLRDGSNNITDSVFFDNTNAWPQEADGDGYSLVLCDPSSDNNLPENWTASENATGIIVNGMEIYADPGQSATCTPTGIIDDNVITTLVYPNPSNGEFRIRMEPMSETCLVKIYNNAGQLVSTSSLAEGLSSADFNEELATGYYTLTIERTDSVERIKLIIE